MSNPAHRRRARSPKSKSNGLNSVIAMPPALRKIGVAFVAVCTFLTVLVASPLVPTAPAQAQQVLAGDQWHQVGEAISLSVTWSAAAEVVGLPPGLVIDNGTITGSVATKGRWPVEVREPAGTTYFQWLITNGAPGGVVAEHPPVDADNVSPRPSEGTDGVVWNRFHVDSTTSLDVTVWDMQQAGPYMYVGGEFEEVIEADGEQEHPQAHLARFSVDTGKWDPTFRPVLDGNVHALELSPRGLLLVGGEFTNIDGQPGTEGLAAIDPSTGSVDPSFEAWVERPWYPEGRAIVRELEVVGSDLYVVGNFSHVNGAGGARVRVHKATRVSANYGTIDPTWMPVISGGSVWGIGIDQDRGRVHMTGRFTSANGSTADSEYVAVTTETGATVQGLQPRPINAPNRPEIYDAEYAAGYVWMAGSQHFVAGVDADTHDLAFWQFAGNSCTTPFCWSGAGTGGDFQFAEKIGDFVFSGCHCTDQYDRAGRPNHYSSVTNERTTHRVAIAYHLDGSPSPTEFDIGGNIDGGWSVATDDVGCIWIGGDIIDGGFYEPGGRVFASGFARFCGDAPAAPDAPQNLVAQVVDPDVVTLQWDEAANATGYRISRDDVEVGIVDSGTFTTWTDNNANLGGSYTYEVRAENRAGTLSEPALVEVIVGFEDTEAPTAPTNVAAIDNGDGSIEVSWDASVDNAGIGSYLVYRDNGYVGFTDAGITTFSDTPPAVGVSYLYEVRAVDINGNRSDKSDPGATVAIGGEDTEPPSVPSNVTAVELGDDDGSVEVAWDASTDNVGVQSYLIYRNGTYLGFTAAGTTTFVETPPQTGVAYLYEVRAVDVNQNRSEKSDPGASITLGGVDLEVPSVPTNLTGTDVGGGSVAVSWDASTDNVGIGSYLIYRDGAYIGYTPAGTTDFSDAPPSEGVAYLYEVRAVDVNGNRSGKTDPGVSVTLGRPDVLAPSVPTNLAGTDVGDGSVAVSWDASTDNVGIGSYLIYRDGAYIGYTPAGTTTFTDVPPAAGVAYLYEVRAVDVNGNRSQKTDPGATVTIGGADLEAPSVPTNLAGTDVGDGSVALSWDASTDNVAVQSYLIYRDGAYIGYTPAGTTTFTDVAPAAGVAYLYEVRAVDVSDNRSEKAPGVTVTIGGVDLEVPSVPTNLTAADVGDGSVAVSWDASTDNVGIGSYLIYRDGAYIGYTPAGTTTFADTPPSAGVEYFYEVRAVDVNGNRSEKTNPGATLIIGGPDLEPPTVPINVASVNPAAGGTELVWDPSVDNVGVASYLVYRDGAYLAWTPGDVTTFTDLTSIAGTTYAYEVRAVDANGNRSDKSVAANVVVQ